jgi:hypothetical protein
MTFEEQLEAIERAYFDAEEENREEVLEYLQKIHQQVLTLPAEEARPYILALADCCGGLLIPYLFWYELLRFLGEDSDSAMIQELLRRFATSNFDEVEQKLLKPLVAIYFYHESEFQLDKFETQVINTSHPEVQNYFKKLLKFAQSGNAASIEAYEEKLRLLKPYYPNFDSFNMPVTRLREEMGLD